MGLFDNQYNWSTKLSSDFRDLMIQKSFFNIMKSVLLSYWYYFVKYSMLLLWSISVSLPVIATESWPIIYNTWEYSGIWTTWSKLSTAGYFSCQYFLHMILQYLLYDMFSKLIFGSGVVGGRDISLIRSNMCQQCPITSPKLMSILCL